MNHRFIIGKAVPWSRGEQKAKEVFIDQQIKLNAPKNISNETKEEVNFLNVCKKSELIDCKPWFIKPIDTKTEAEELLKTQEKIEVDCKPYFIPKDEQLLLDQRPHNEKTYHKCPKAGHDDYGLFALWNDEEVYCFDCVLSKFLQRKRLRKILFKILGITLMKKR